MTAPATDVRHQTTAEQLFRTRLRQTVAVVAIASPAVYLLSDLVETYRGGFSTSGLSLTYAGEAAIPLFVLGLYALQLPKIGRLGLGGAVLYAYSYVFFTGTVLYALIAGTKDWDALSDRFGAWLTIHGAIMVLGGVAFGAAVLRADVLPRWTGFALIVGVLLVAAASGQPDWARTIAAAVPDAAFAGMGFALLSGRR